MTEQTGRGPEEDGMGDGCGCSGCVFGDPGGMRPSAGCQCVKSYDRVALRTLARRLGQRLRKARAERDEALAEAERLRAWVREALDDPMDGPMCTCAGECGGTCLRGRGEALLGGP